MTKQWTANLQALPAAEKYEYDHQLSLVESAPQLLPPPTSKSRRQLSNDAIAHALLLNCCTSHCMSRQTAETVRKHRERYFSMSERDRMQWLIDWLRNSHELASPHHNTDYHIDGKPVCRAAFCIAHGISKWKLDHAQTYVRACAVVPPPHGNTGQSHASQSDACFKWLAQHLLLVCDKISDNLWLLPEPTTDRDLYLDFVQRYTIEHSLPASTATDVDTKSIANPHVPSEETFIRTLRSCFAHVRSPRKSDLTRCDECCRIRQRRLQIHSRADATVVETEMRLHGRLHTAERRAMESVVARSNSFPHELMCLTIDYSKSVYLPHMPLKSKELAGAELLEMQFGGAIVYSSDERFVYTHLPLWPKGSGLMCTLVFDLIRSARASTHEHRHARSLQLFVDNAWGEFKNVWFIGFLAWLIAAGWFDEIILSMLIVGHTHTAIDQMFSVVHKYNETHHSVTPSDWIASLDSAYPSTDSAARKPAVCVVDSITDWKSWLEPVLANYTGHSRPNHFRLTRGSDGHIAFVYKFGYDSAWSTERIRVFNDQPLPLATSEPSILTARTTVPFTFANRKHLIADSQHAALAATAAAASLSMAASAAHASVRLIVHPAGGFRPSGGSVHSNSSAAAATAAPIRQCTIVQRTIRPLPASKRVDAVQPTASSSSAAAAAAAAPAAKSDRLSSKRNGAASTSTTEYLVDDLVDIKRSADGQFSILVRWYVCCVFQVLHFYDRNVCRMSDNRV
jgi:hypothetical protein